MRTFGEPPSENALEALKTALAVRSQAGSSSSANELLPLALGLSPYVVGLSSGSRWSGNGMPSGWRYCHQNARRDGAHDGARTSRLPRPVQGSLCGVQGITRPLLLARHLRLQRLEHQTQSRVQIADGTPLGPNRAELGTQPFESAAGRERRGGQTRRGWRVRRGGCAIGIGAHGSA